MLGYCSLAPGSWGFEENEGRSDQKCMVGRRKRKEARRKRSFIDRYDWRTPRTWNAFLLTAFAMMATCYHCQQ